MTYSKEVEKYSITITKHANNKTSCKLNSNSKYHCNSYHNTTLTMMPLATNIQLCII